MKNRPKCKIDGCNNVATKIYNKKHKKQYYRSWCNKHYEIRRGIYKKKQLQRGASHYNLTIEEYKELNVMKCSLCGWDKTTCDIHRIMSGKMGGKYKKDNIIILCPNCHRLIHKGLIKI